MYKLYRYNDNCFRIVGIPNHFQKNDIDKNKTGITDSNEVLRISTSRARSKINEYIKCNDCFKYFFTVTVSSQNCDRYSLIETQNLIRQKIKKIKRKNFNFKYIFVTETHKDGAFHFHGVCSEIPVYRNDYGYYSNIIFDEIGFNSLSPIKDLTACSYYITKYITKDIVKKYCGNSYFCSKGLKKAESYEIYGFSLDRFDTPQHNFKDKNNFNKKEFCTYYKNDYCTSIEFNPNTLNTQDLQYLIYNIKDV